MTDASRQLIYGRHQHVPLQNLLVLGLQHTVLMASTLGLPVALMLELGSDRTASVVSLTMIAAGVGTILQAVQFGPIGSGYLCPNLCGPNFFATAAAAAWLGGLPLMQGMTLFAGLFATACAFWIERLRRWFTPEVVGVVMLMIAVSLVPIGASRFLNVPYVGDPIQNSTALVGFLSLTTMIAASVSSARIFRLNSVVFGIAIGYIANYLFAEPDALALEKISSADWIGIPNLAGGFNFDFRWQLAPTFMIVAICGMLKSLGNLTIAQAYDNGDDAPLDMRPIRGGLVADGLAVALSGLMGGLPTDTSASNVAMSGATGATSRYIGFAAGGMFVLFGLSPKITATLTLMPAAISGAIVLFVTSLVFSAGMRSLAQSFTTPIKTFAVGLGLIAGLSATIAPALYADVYSWMRPITESPLSLATIVTIGTIQIRAAFEHLNIGSR